MWRKRLLDTHRGVSKYQEGISRDGRTFSLGKRRLQRDLVALHNSLMGARGNLGSAPKEQVIGCEEMASSGARGGSGHREEFFCGKGCQALGRDGIPVPGCAQGTPGRGTDGRGGDQAQVGLDGLGGLFQPGFCGF